MALATASLLLLCIVSSAGAQTAPPPKSGKSEGTFTVGQPETHISKQQAKELFRSVDDILHFASDDSRLPIRREVKRRLTNREAVEKYIVDKFNNDDDAKRMQRAEIVLKKFGMFDRDFELRPFLVSLLKEQIAGYYDSKTKTVNLLDWIDPAQQKSVLAHELTHALQDQHTDLDKWDAKTATDVATNVKEDNQHIDTDEEDTARDAVLEGQAMAVFMDYSLKPAGQTMLTAPDMVEKLKDDMADSSGSPVLARAPLLLEQTLLFPYRDGLSFEQVLLKDGGPAGAFANVLDDPPSTSYEIMNPHAYEAKKKIPVLHMPDVHPLLDATYEPLDVGVMGQLDVRILTELLGGKPISQGFTPAWDGGIYYAAQRRSAKTAEEKTSTASLGLLYLSGWKSEQAAGDFATLYGAELDKKYSHVVRSRNDETVRNEQIYNTSEGPVLIVHSGKQVFVSESFDMPTARKLQLLMLGAQTDEDTLTAENRPGGNSQARSREPSYGELSISMAQLMARCGVMKAALPHLRP
jgi:hypothetical protein